MNVHLTQELELVELQKQELRKKIVRGLDSLQRGEGVEGDEFFADLEACESALARKSRKS